VPPVWLLSEGNFDQKSIQPQQKFHCNGDDAPHCGSAKRNRIRSFAISRGESTSKEKQVKKKLGEVMIRPLMFDDIVASKLPFQGVLSQLAASGLRAYLTQVVPEPTGYPAVYVLDHPAQPTVKQMCSEGAAEHTLPCCLAVYVIEDSPSSPQASALPSSPIVL
jgi:hypothetical protein